MSDAAEGIIDVSAPKEYLTKDVFMRERVESFIVSVRGACAALGEYCSVPPLAIMELVSENLVSTTNKPT